MSRHRDVRNLDADDYGDDDYASSYGSSYTDETHLSSSMENYMYRRHGGTPKMGQFVHRSDSVPSVPEEDEEGVVALDPITNEPIMDPVTGKPVLLYGDDRPRVRCRSDSETSNTSSSGSNSNHSSFSCDHLSLEEQNKLSACLEEILDIVGDTQPEHVLKEAIVRCDFNTEVAVNTLLNNPVGHRSGGGGGAHRDKRPRPATPPLRSVPPPEASTSAATPQASTSSVAIPVASTPSAAIPLPATNKKPIRIITTGAEPEPSTPMAVQRLKPKEARSRSQSPAVSRGASAQASNQPSPSSSGTATPVPREYVSSSTASSSASKTPMRKAKLDAQAEYDKTMESEKELLNLVVVGHVDSGKSTLMGHVLFSLGTVSQRVMHKYEQESKKLGKQSFAYAWVLDETSEERERGITMDVGQSRFETPTKSVTLLDAPGHKDFIPNMISGAYQADVAILVVNATRGEFEAGFDAGGQTREHALLVRSLGVSQIAVAVNKLDTVNWSQERFDAIVLKLRTFLKQVGFKDADVAYVPCSGYTGDNLIAKTDKLPWYSGKTLLEAVDSFRPPERLVQKPFRMSISDLYKSQQSGFSCSGRIEAGFVQKDDKVLIVPLNELASVRNVLVDDSPRARGFAGDHVTLNLTGPDMTSITFGMVACDPARPILTTRRVRARIVVFNIDVPLTKGFPVVYHFGSVQTQAVIKKLVSVINKSTGEVTKSKPRVLTKNCNAVVEIGLDAPICAEIYKDVKELGRFMLRSSGKTIAAGLITDIL